jgi:uncharacterized protein (TIGR03067 family)
LRTLLGDLDTRRIAEPRLSPWSGSVEGKRVLNGLGFIRWVRLAEFGPPQEGVLQAMNNLKPLMAVLLTLWLLPFGGWLLEPRTAGAQQQPQRDRGEQPQTRKLAPAQEKALQEKEEGQKDKQAPTDDDKLRGRWKVIYAEQDGKPIDNDTIYTFQQKGSVAVESPKGKFYPYVCRYKLDSSTTPKTLDMEWAVSKGVYVLDGDTLVHRITYELTDEKGKAVQQTLLLVFKRVEPIIEKWRDR